jgi:Glucodextranase, domain B
VDGHTAYVPGMGGPSDHALGAPGLAPVDFHPSYNPATGVLTIGETGVVQRCSGSDAADPLATDCGSKVDTGVRITRHWVTGTDGTSATLTETWSVADGGTHQISMLPEADGTSTRSEYDFPWLGQGYVHYMGDPSLPGPGPGSGPTSFFTASDNPSGGSSTLSYGSLTTSVPPDSIPFYGVAPASGNEFPQIAYARTITPSQPFSYTWKLATGLTDASVRARAATDADSLAAPVVKITAPAGGSKTTSSKMSVTGTATDNVGVTAFTVNGNPVPLGSGGAFSTTVPLKPGANTIVAQAGDRTGNTSQASVALTRIRQCVVPHLKGRTLSRARRALGKAHCKLGKVRKGYRTHLAGKRGHRTRVPFKTGRIVAQHPKAGSKKKLGAKVNVVVQRAKPKQP